MKKLGLVGGTGPESTLAYYREINRRVNERTGNACFPEMAVESVDLIKALGIVSGKRYDELEEYILGRIRNLENGGAEIIALTAATMHIIYDRLKDKVRVPFVSIPEVAAEYAVSQGYSGVGLLGTIFTMENDYLSRSFVNRGISVFTPSAEDRILVNKIISTELEYGVVKDESVDMLVSVIEKMKAENGIEAVILGCTELPLALNNENSPVSCIDIMDVHIDRLSEMII